MDTYGNMTDSQFFLQPFKDHLRFASPVNGNLPVTSVHFHIFSNDRLFLFPQAPEGHGTPCQTDKELRTIWMREPNADQISSLRHTNRHTWALHALFSLVFQTLLEISLAHSRSCSYSYIYLNIHAPMLYILYIVHSYIHTHTRTYVWETLKEKNMTWGHLLERTHLSSKHSSGFILLFLFFKVKYITLDEYKDKTN